MSRLMKRLCIGAPLAAAAALFLTGCTALTTQVLVDEKAQPRSAVVSHCSGSEWTDNSMMALVPLPVIGLGMPTQEINEINTEDVLSKCGPLDRLANRHVEVDRFWCVPTVVTRVFSLGVWHWCPANISYEADVIAPAPRASAGAASAPQAEFGEPYQLGARP